MLGAHGLVEDICFVHLVCLGLLRVQPALKELRVVFGEGLIPLLDLTQLKLQGANFVVQNLVAQDLDQATELHCRVPYLDGPIFLCHQLLVLGNLLAYSG